MAKRLFHVLLVLSVLLSIMAGPSWANLITIGTAEYNGGSYNLIYDAVSPFGPIVWLDYSHQMDTWNNQVSWANSLNESGAVNENLISGVNITWGGGWRLPITLDGTFMGGYDGTTTGGYNNTSSEMGHLYYSELGNKAYYNTNGSSPQQGWGLTNTGPFNNLLPDWYWSGTGYAIDPSFAWNFSNFPGSQNITNKYYSGYALAVRPASLVGDSNHDGTVNVFDALLTLQYAVGLIEHNAENNAKYAAVADVAPLDANGKPTGDDKVDVFDALGILRHAVRLDTW